MFGCGLLEFRWDCFPDFSVMGRFPQGLSDEALTG